MTLQSWRFQEEKQKYLEDEAVELKLNGARPAPPTMTGQGFCQAQGRPKQSTAQSHLWVGLG